MTTVAHALEVSSDITPELDEEILRAAQMLVTARRVTGLTGAGVSVESGIPPFRGKGGLWTKYGEPPMDGYQRFLKDPRGHWQEQLSPRKNWAQGLHEALSRAKPNAAHAAFAELERRGICAVLITQNVDDLHGQAGTSNLLEIHGNHNLLRCIECVARYREGEIAIDPEKLPPLCPACGGIVKGDTVHFGEPIPPDVLRRCYDEVADSDCMIVAGTSATVFPAADFPREILRNGGAIIEVNPEPTELTGVATCTLTGPGGTVMTRLLYHVVTLSEEAVL